MCEIKPPKTRVSSQEGATSPPNQEIMWGLQPTTSPRSPKWKKIPSKV